MGHYSNKITELSSRTFTDGVRVFNDGTYCNSIYGDNNVLVKQGEAVGVFYGYKTNGVFSTEAEAQQIGLKYRNAAGNDVSFGAGDVQFVDQNGDGYIDENDKVVLGNPNPSIYGNIFATATWKRFTLDVNFNYCVGNDVYNYQRSVLNSGSTFYNQQVSELEL